MKRETQAQLTLLTSGFLFALYGPLTRLSGNDFGPITQSAIRTVMRIMIVLMIIFFVRGIKKIKPQDIKWFLISGIAAAITTILFVVAVSALPMGTTMFLFYGSSLIISYLIGKFFFKESLTRTKIFSLIIAIGGLLLMFGEKMGSGSIIMLILACLAGLAYGIYSSLSKKISGNYSSIEIILTNSIIEAIIYFGLSIFIVEKSNFAVVTPWIVSAIYALIVVINGYLLIFGFKHLEAQKAIVIMLSELIFVMILGFILYSEVPTLLNLIGSILILGAMLIPNLNWKNVRAKS